MTQSNFLLLSRANGRPKDESGRINVKKEGRLSRRPQRSFLLVPIPVTVMMVARMIGVVAMMVVMVMVAIMAMMIAVPSCGWDRAAGRDCANNT